MRNNYFTLKEISSQPEVWAEVGKEVHRIKEDLRRFFLDKNYQKVVFTGCGSSYYLAIVASRVFGYLTGKGTFALPASELLLYPEIYLRKNKNYLLISISRSGESTETVNVLTKIRENYKAKVLGVSCYEGSTLVKNSDFALVLPQAREKSVVMTRSFTSMLLALLLTSCIVAEEFRCYQELQKLPKLGEKNIERCKDYCEHVIKNSKCEKFIYLGSGPFYGLACEGALKMKEMANLSCEVYHVLEYLHGPKSNADEKTMVCLLLLGRTNGYMRKFLQELASLGLQILVECEKATPELKSKAKYILQMNSGLSDYTGGLLYMIPMQLIAFYNTVKKGLNPDRPRNLTQVVRY